MRCTSHIVHTLYHHDQKMFVLAFDAIMFLLLLHVKFNMLNMQGARHHKTVNGSPQLLFFGSDLMISDLLRAPCRGVASPSPCASPETRLLPSESQRHSAGEEGTWRNIKSQFSWWRWCFLHTWWHTVFLITFGCMFLKSRLKIFLRLMNGSMIEAYWHVIICSYKGAVCVLVSAGQYDLATFTILILQPIRFLAEESHAQHRVQWKEVIGSCWIHRRRRQ